MDALRISSFNIVSVLTTTGFGLGDFGTWGPLTTIIFIILLALGACSGSTSGGLKIFGSRWPSPCSETDAPADAPLRRVSPEVQRPSGQRRHHPLPDLLRAGLLRHHPADRRPARRHRAGPLTAISGSITAVANVGPGMGLSSVPAPTFASLPDAAKWILSFGMLLGRLEILTVAVLFFPSFWKQ